MDEFWGGVIIDVIYYVLDYQSLREKVLPNTFGSRPSTSELQHRSGYRGVSPPVCRGPRGFLKTGTQKNNLQHLRKQGTSFGGVMNCILDYQSLGGLVPPNTVGSRPSTSELEHRSGYRGISPPVCRGHEVLPKIIFKTGSPEKKTNYNI